MIFATWHLLRAGKNCSRNFSKNICIRSVNRIFLHIGIVCIHFCALFRKRAGGERAKTKKPPCFRRRPRRYDSIFQKCVGSASLRTAFPLECVGCVVFLRPTAQSRGFLAQKLSGIRVSGMVRRVIRPRAQNSISGCARRCSPKRPDTCTSTAWTSRRRRKTAT